MKVLRNMNKFIRYALFIFAWFFFVSVFLINFDTYSELLSIFQELGLVSTLFIYANLGVFNPLLAPAFTFSLNMSIYLKLLSILIFTALLIFLYKKTKEDKLSLSKTLLLLAFVLFSTSLLYKTFSILVLVFMVLSFYSLKKQIFEGKSYLFLISFTLLVISNWLLAIVTAMALFVLAIYYVEDDQNFRLKSLDTLIINILLSLGMGAFIFIPSFSIGSALPHNLSSIPVAMILLILIVTMYNFKRKQKRLSSISLLIFSLAILFYYNLFLLPFMVLFFIVFYDFVKEYNLDIYEIALMILFLLIGFSFSFTQDLIYPMIVSKYSDLAIWNDPNFKFSKILSFMALTISMIKVFVESSKMKIFKNDNFML